MTWLEDLVEDQVLTRPLTWRLGFDSSQDSIDSCQEQSQIRLNIESPSQVTRLDSALTKSSSQVFESSRVMMYVYIFMQKNFFAHNSYSYCTNIFFSYFENTS